MRIFQKFISIETSGGFFLFLAAIIAMMWSNSSFYTSYTALSQLHFSISIDHFTQEFSLPFIVDEILMTLFFLLIGLEVKRELIEGELNGVKKAILPAIAALGGMLIPAGIYALLNWQHADAIRGWAIPTATDIAFSLGVLSLLGSRIPLGLKVFLTALAIFDDLGAIVIIAIFYTKKIFWGGIALAALLEIGLILLNIFKIVWLPLYFIAAILLWWLLLISGIHPTLAGVLVALTVPLNSFSRKAVHKTQKKFLSPVKHLEQLLHPWVTFFILPLFAFINAGIELHSFFENVMTSISLGITLGLFLGKPLGILSFCWLAIKSKWAHFPQGVHWKNLIGVSLLCGIGFTMSFFIGFLSFDQSSLYYQNQLRSGILLGSLLSGIFGYIYLCVTLKGKS